MNDIERELYKNIIENLKQQNQEYYMIIQRLLARNEVEYIPYPVHPFSPYTTYEFSYGSDASKKYKFTERNEYE